jgi:hypothetical protein
MVALATRLTVADVEGEEAGSAKPTQKHPATFQVEVSAVSGALQSLAETKWANVEEE